MEGDTPCKMSVSVGYAFLLLWSSMEHVADSNVMQNLNLILFSRSTPGAQLVLPKLTLPPASYVSHKICDSSKPPPAKSDRLTPIQNMCTGYCPNQAAARLRNVELTITGQPHSPSISRYRRVDHNNSPQQVLTQRHRYKVSEGYI